MISFSISVAIVLKPFYYVQIKTLHIQEKTGYTYQEIKEAYDDVLNYTTLNHEFKTGKLKYSEEGKNHFKDCKTLFMINFILLGLSFIIIILKRIFLKDIKLKKYPIEYWSSWLILIIFLLITATTLILGYNKIFEWFHQIFFLGQDNWLFNPAEDEIINILPKEYFMNCSILIVGILFITTGIIIGKEFYKKRQNHAS